jgi:hypothetical protein
MKSPISFKRFFRLNNEVCHRESFRLEETHSRCYITKTLKRRRFLREKVNFGMKCFSLTKKTFFVNFSWLRRTLFLIYSGLEAVNSNVNNSDFLYWWQTMQKIGSECRDKLFLFWGLHTTLKPENRNKQEQALAPRLSQASVGRCILKWSFALQTHVVQI